MLPQKHFDKIEKDAVDMIGGHEPAKDEKIAKKVVEIKENAIEKNAKTVDEDDSDDSDDDDYYDYNYDDDSDNYNEDLVTLTPKTVTTTTTTTKCM